MPKLIMIPIDGNMLIEWKYNMIDNDLSCGILSLKFLKALDEDEFIRLYEKNKLIGTKYSQITQIVQSTLQNNNIVNRHTLPLNEIDRLLKNSYGTIIMINFAKTAMGHIAVLAKNALGQLVYIDPQTDKMVIGINNIRDFFKIKNIIKIQVCEKHKHRNISKKQRLNEIGEYEGDYEKMEIPFSIDVGYDDANIPSGEVNPKKHSRNENIIRKPRETSSTLTIEDVKKHLLYRIPTKIKKRKGTRKSRK